MLNSTCDYSQPSFYKFSQDSIVLSKEGLRLLEKKLSEGPIIRALDLFSGCGVVGLEIMRNFKKNISFDFLEIQNDYKNYFNENKKKFLNRGECDKARFINEDYLSFCSNENLKYDFIISNPPYFNPRKNRLSENPKKNLCRFFLKSDFYHFLKFILDFLSKRGVAVFLLREDEVNQDIRDFLTKYEDILKIEKLRSLQKVSLFTATLLDK
jgi:tRNA1(Val) A37 N6-methylase TrmN6